MRTSEEARGQWRTILPQLGIHKKYLTGRNGPCPLCGGTDRFRFTDRQKDGDYYCNQCGAGKAFKLIMKFRGWDFRTAAEAVDGILGRKPSIGGPCSSPIQPPVFDRDQWEPAKSVRDATLWLRRHHPERLRDWLYRNEPELRQWLNRTRPWGYYPEERKIESVRAMLAAGMGVDWGKDG